MMFQLRRRILGAGRDAGKLDIAHPKLDELHRLWEGKRGRRRAPARADFSFAELKPWFGHLMVLDCLPGGDFRYRLYGSDLASQFGFDLTGRVVSDIARLIGEKPLQEYRQVVLSGQPLYVSRSSPSSHEYLAVDKLALPLVEDGVIAKILGAIYLSDQT